MMRPLTLPLALLAATLAALMLGQLPIGPLALIRGALSGEGPGALVLGVLRGPRVATALGAGAALGMSGMLFQTLFRNPLAAPDLMGFTSGAGLAILLGVSFQLMLPAPLLAAAGGLGAAALVALLSWRPRETVAPLTLVLVGLGVGFLASALSSFLMTALPPNEAGDAQRWLTGSLNARNWSQAGQVWLAVAVLGTAALALQDRLETLRLGDALAAGLGLRVAPLRWSIALVAVLLAASAVAVAGPVPFVALMAGPVGAQMTGATRLPGRLAAAAGAGALILILADLAARAALPGTLLPVGVATGLFGAPYLMWRLTREMTRGGL